MGEFLLIMHLRGRIEVLCYNIIMLGQADRCPLTDVQMFLWYSEIPQPDTHWHNIIQVFCRLMRVRPFLKGSKCIRTIGKPNCPLYRGLLHCVPISEGPLIGLP